MLFIVKFNQRLHAACRDTVMAVQRGDEVGAMRTASKMSQDVVPLAQEALRKSQTALISGNDQVYASMAHKAQMIVAAGNQIASASHGDREYDQANYQRGVAMLSAAWQL